jgi:hypothetical protein
VILYEGKPEEVGLLIAAIILLGVGVMPLIAVTVGMLRIMYVEYLVENARLLTNVTQNCEGLRRGPPIFQSRDPLQRPLPHGRSEPYHRRSVRWAVQNTERSFFGYQACASWLHNSCGPSGILDWLPDKALDSERAAQPQQSDCKCLEERCLLA